MREPLHVQLESRSYPIRIGHDLLKDVGTILRTHGFRQREALVITNAQVGDFYFQPLAAALAQGGFERVLRHDLPSTEAGKSWDELSLVCATLVREFPDTGSIPLVILLGGGVVGDLGGFAAAVFRRGVPFVQMPTTLLAAVDSSVGGKLAVNFGGVKNILGVFAQPSLVVADLALLHSLDVREVRSGMAEVIKYGAVCSAALFEQLERGDLERMLARHPETLADIVEQCCRLKAAVVEKDEFDKMGIRNVLNFGHTVGHALELSVNYRLTHGEAISIGMVAATHLARALGMVAADFEGRLVGLLGRAGLLLTFPDEPGLYDRVLRAMQMDKKFRDGRNVFVLPTEVGAWKQAENVDWTLVHAAVRSILR